MKVKTVHSGSALIDYRVIDDDVNGIPILIMGGVGGSHLVFAQICKFLRNTHPIILVEYPGLPGGNLGTDKPSVENLAMYLKAIIDNENYKKVCLLGWSTGCMVLFEFAAKYTASVKTMIMLSGSRSNPFKIIPKKKIDQALEIRGSIPQASSWILDHSKGLNRIKNFFKSSKAPASLAIKLGFVSPVVDSLLFDGIVKNFIALNPKIFTHYLETLREVKTYKSVDDIDVPVLAMAGNKDMLISPSVTKNIIGKKTVGEFFLIKGGTHFLPFEYPQLISAKIKDFFKRNGIK